MSFDTLITVPLGFGLGFLIGLTGVGGGALVAPALYVLVRLSYQDAITLSLIYSFFTKIVGALQHIHQGTVRWRPALLYGLTGVPGAIVGPASSTGPARRASASSPWSWRGCS